MATLQRLLRLLALGDLALERVVQLGERPRLAEQIDEDADLRAQDLRVDRLAQIVDRADTVAAQDVVLVDRVRRQEQDRDVLRALALLDQRRQLDAAHARHLDVEHDRRELVPHQAEQRLVGRRRADQRAVDVAEHHLEHVEVSRLIVDDEDLRLLVRCIMAQPAVQRYSQTRSSDSS